MVLLWVVGSFVKEMSEQTDKHALRSFNEWFRIPGSNPGRSSKSMQPYQLPFSFNCGTLSLQPTCVENTEPIAIYLATANTINIWVAFLGVWLILSRVSDSDLGFEKHLMQRCQTVLACTHNICLGSVVMIIDAWSPPTFRGRSISIPQLLRMFLHRRRLPLGKISIGQCPGNRCAYIMLYTTLFCMYIQARARNMSRTLCIIAWHVLCQCTKDRKNARDH